MAGRHTTILPRTKPHREGICRKVICPGTEILREESKESECAECGRDSRGDTGISGKVRICFMRLGTLRDS